MHDNHDRHDDHAGPGHNSTGASPAQWQTPHLPEGAKHRHDQQTEPDLDLVEQSFVEGFSRASDPTSFLRLAGVPFKAKDADGRTLCLLRVQMDQTTDVGSVTPHIGGQSYRYDPLPTKMISRRQNLRFIYHDGETLRELPFEEISRLERLPS